MSHTPAPAAPARPLNLRQQRFVQEYLADGVASAAARRAGYSAKSSLHSGHQLMKNPRVLAAIAAERARRAAPMTREMAIAALRAIGEANVLDYARTGPDGALELDLWRLERDRAGAVRELTVVEKTDPVSGVVTRTVGFKLADRSAALMKLLPMLKSPAEAAEKSRSWEHGAESVAELSVAQFERLKALREEMGRERAAGGISAAIDRLWDEEIGRRMSEAEAERARTLAAREADLDALAEELDRQWDSLDADRRAVQARELAVGQREAAGG